MLATRALRLPRVYLPQLNWQTAFLAGIVGLVAYLVLVPMALMVIVSFRTTSQTNVWGGAFTFSNYREAFFNSATYELLGNTFVFTFGSTALGMALGIGFAWLVERTNVPLRNFAYAIVPLNAAVPGVLFAISWVLLLSPRFGLYNEPFRLLGWQEGPLSPYNLAGMTIIEGFRVSATVFLMVIGLFRSMDPSLEEAAATSRAGTLTTLRRVTLPLMLPGVLAVLLYVSTGLIGVFEIPAILGMPGGVYVFSTRIWEATHRVPRDYGLAGSLSVFFVAVSLIGIWLYHRVLRVQQRFATVTGKGYRPRVMDLGRWKYLGSAVILLYFLFIVAGPLFILAWASFQPYYAPPSLQALERVSLKAYHDLLTTPYFMNALKNTAILVLVVPFGTMFLSAIMSWIVVRTRLSGRKFLDLLAFLPHTMPSIVIGLAYLWLYLILDFIPIYGTIWIIALGLITNYLAFGTRATNGAMYQIHQELEEAGALSGANWFRTFRRITIPLLLPSLVSGWIWVAMHAVRELSMALMLYSPDSRILSVLIWSFWQNGQVSLTAALGVILTLFVAVILLIGRLLAVRTAREY